MIRGCLYGSVTRAELDDADLTIMDWIDPVACVAAISAECGRELSSERIEVVVTEDAGRHTVWLSVDLPDEVLAQEQ